MSLNFPNKQNASSNVKILLDIFVAILIFISWFNKLIWFFQGVDDAWIFLTPYYVSCTVKFFNI